MDYCKEYSKFTKACGNIKTNTPQKLTSEDVSFITNMIQDELSELKEADTIVDQADALVDMIAYINDIAIRRGINLDPLFGIVLESNMSKVDKNGKVIRRADGKIMKPESFIPPEPKLAQEIQRQIVGGSFK